MKKLFEMMDDLIALVRFLVSRVAPLAAVLALLTIVGQTPAAHADTLLLASTNMVTGSSGRRRMRWPRRSSRNSRSVQAPTSRTSWPRPVARSTWGCIR
jgi:hypothetical protein